MNKTGQRPNLFLEQEQYWSCIKHCANMSNITTCLEVLQES